MLLNIIKKFIQKIYSIIKNNVSLYLKLNIKEVCIITIFKFLKLNADHLMDLSCSDISRVTFLFSDVFVDHIHMKRAPYGHT